MRYLILLISLLAAGCTEETSSASGTDAVDYVYTNGKVYTADDDNPWAEAVAVRGSDIVYVGDTAGIDAYIGPNTTVDNLDGKVLLPGMISTHDHATAFMPFRAGLVMPNNGDPKWMLDQLAQYIAENPDGPFFSFGGAFEGAVMITREEIDAIVPDKPFLMIGQGGHGGWANTLALELSGVVKGQPDPIDSYGRHEDGTPTGEITASPGVFWIVKELGLVEKEAIIEAAPPVMENLNSKGVVASYEVMTFPGTEEAVFAAMHELEQRGALTVRFAMCTAIQRPVHIEGALEKLKRFGPMYSSEFFNVNTLKIHGDGAFENRTAAVLEPYPDQPDWYGFLAMPAEQVKDVMLRTAGAGFNIHTHTVGDRAARWALDGFQAVRDAGHHDVRLATGHTMLVDEADKPRFAELNVSVNTLSPQTIPTEAAKLALDQARYERMMPVGTLAAQGARIASSADFPVFDINPFPNMYMMITRKELGGDEVLPPESDRITLEQAIRSYTIDAAYLLGFESFIGSIEVGKRADLVVVDRDIFVVSLEEMAAADVVSTMVNGQIVFDPSSLQDPTDPIRPERIQ
jgi:predicted amidohydrolase YtcJ